MPPGIPRPRLRVQELCLHSLRGVGQIMLQASAATGVLLLLGLALVSIPMATAAWVASALATICAWALRFPAGDQATGYYGFNAALVGIGLLAFYPPTVGTWSAVAAGAIVATALLRGLQKAGISAYTFPFILILWLAFALVPRPVAGILAMQSFVPSWTEAVLQGFSQVVFLEHSGAGLLFLLGVAAHSRRCALLALAAAVGATAAAQFMSWDPARIASGVYGYNPVLAAVATALFERGWARPMVAAAVALCITHLMLIWALPALTFPFVAATWLMLVARHHHGRRQGPHPLQPGI